MSEKKIPFSVNRNDVRPLFNQVVDGFRGAIISGYYEPGDKIPSSRDLCPILGVSRIVTQAALEQLAAEELVVSRPRIGTVVCDRGTKLWRGTVLFVNAGGTFSAYAVTLASALRKRLVSAGFLFSVIDMPSRSIEKADVARLSVALASRPNLAVLLHARPEVLAAVVKSGVDYVVVNDGVKPLGGDMPDSCRGVVATEYSAAISDFVEHCMASGVRRVLEVGFENGYASAAAALRRTGIGVSLLRVKISPEFRHYGHVQHAGLAAADKLLATGKSSLPDLIYFTDDYLAAGALVSFARHCIRFPEDMRLVSLATKGFEPLWWQDVTRIEWDWFAQGEDLARRVVDLLNSRIACVSTAISPRYITGETFPETTEVAR